jgi:hypothetical protein
MAYLILNPTEEQEKALEVFLEALDVFYIKHDVDNEELPLHVSEGIVRAREDIKAGRIATFEEIKRKYPIR